MDRDPRRKPDSRTCERKALSERDSCVCILKMRAEALHKRTGSISARGLRSRSKILPRSAQVLIVIGKAFTMHVNARSSNHDPSHVLDRNPKRLSERDSFSCEHSHCWLRARRVLILYRVYRITALLAQMGEEEGYYLGVL